MAIEDDDDDFYEDCSYCGGNHFDDDGDYDDAGWGEVSDDV